MKKITLAVLATILPLPFILSAQWESDVRLTFADYARYTSEYNSMWCVATDGDFVHATYFGYGGSGWEVYYMRSTDAGATWEPEILISETPTAGIEWPYPSVAVSGSNVHISWGDDPGIGNYDMYYKRSLDNGITWEPTTRLTTNSSAQLYSSMAVSGSNIHIVWTDSRDGGWTIYYKRSTDNGTSWGPDTRLSEVFPINSTVPSIAVSGSNVYVVWIDDRDGGNPEVYYKRSTDNGTTWSSDIPLTTNAGVGNFRPASIAVSGSYVYVIWDDNRDGNLEIYYKRSTDGGITWGPDARLTIDPSASLRPSVAVSVSNVHVIWQDYRDGNYEIYYKRSTDAGMTWESDTRLTNVLLTSENPFIALSGTIVHVIWVDWRDGDREIYYKRNPTGNLGKKEEPPETKVPEILSPKLLYSPSFFKDKITLKFSKLSEKPLKITLYNVFGNPVYKKLYSLFPSSLTLEDEKITELPKGIYFLLVYSGYGKLEQVKMIKP